ncbi:MAG: hypothetical protein J5625_08970 [Lachnospiraceae bacterium]|nr:hypothetical protein [Lachnospiraceae bacterium]
MNEIEIAKFMRKITRLMYVSFGLWIFIVVIQFVIGLATLAVGYGFATLCLMIYNLIGCIRYMKVINSFRHFSTKPEAAAAVSYFENSIGWCWVFMFVNLVLGGIIGFVGNLYDLILAYYVKSKKAELLMPSGVPGEIEVPNPRDYE